MAAIKIAAAKFGCIGLAQNSQVAIAANGFLSAPGE
jgi:hypothetical protein